MGVDYGYGEKKRVAVQSKKPGGYIHRDSNMNKYRGHATPTPPGPRRKGKGPAKKIDPGFLHPRVPTSVYSKGKPSRKKRIGRAM